MARNATNKILQNAKKSKSDEFYTQLSDIESELQYSGKRLSEIQTKPCLAWFIARDTVLHTTAHRYIIKVILKIK